MAAPEIEESSHSNARLNLSQLKLSPTLSQAEAGTRVEGELKVGDGMEVKTRLLFTPPRRNVTLHVGVTGCDCGPV